MQLQVAAIICLRKKEGAGNKQKTSYRCGRKHIYLLLAHCKELENRKTDCSSCWLSPGIRKNIPYDIGETRV